MTPFTDFLYFGISLYVLIPALIAGFFKRGWRVWLVIATIAMLFIQYSTSRQVLNFVTSELVLLIGYAAIQWLITILFLSARRKASNRATLYFVLFLNLLPVTAAN